MKVYNAIISVNLCVRLRHYFPIKFARHQRSIISKFVMQCFWINKGIQYTINHFPRMKIQFYIFKTNVLEKISHNLCQVFTR